MSSLKDRLKRLTGSSGGAGSADTRNESETMKQDTPPHNSYSVEALDPDWEKLEATLIRTEWGSFIRRRRLYSPDYRHGSYRLADLRGCGEELSVFQGEGVVNAHELLFFDTETTGLGVGAGNVPFMIGIGFWEESGFAVEQLFIRNPAEELAMLAYLKPIMVRYPYLVSYNGRTFDWPLLQNRFVMNRMKEGLPDPKHFDFLYPSRSLWKNTLPSCRLSKVEEAQLGFHRVDDVPGSMAPTLYFLYLAERKPESVGPVFIHNELDILSLAGLAVLFAETLAGRFGSQTQGAEETYRLGLWLHKMGKAELSRQVLKRLHPEGAALSGGSGGWIIPLAAHYKQIGALDDAVALWLMAIEQGRESGKSASPPLEPYIELAMYYEHRMKDIQAALLYAQEALEWAERRRSLFQSVLRRGNPRQRGSRRSDTRGDAVFSPSPRDKDEGGGGTLIVELEKRVERLTSKIAKAAAEDDRTPKPRKRKPRSPSHLPAAVHETLTLF